MSDVSCVQLTEGVIGETHKGFGVDVLLWNCKDVRIFVSRKGWVGGEMVLYLN